MLATACALSALPVQASTNMLVDGGLEYQPMSPMSSPPLAIHTYIGGCITTGSGVHWMNESLGYFTDPTGIYAIDLADYGYANGGIKHSFATTVGGLYSVSFAGMAYKNAGNPDGKGEITALIDNHAIQTYQLLNQSSASNAWQSFNFTFSAA
ncbi:MAG TPA: hypothetical protein PLE48_14005 [Thiobacillus sp.]|nr:hypothetical protein [Thiobacillus sp.]HQT71522.1 hypothetical protein [Thiobacillus sp.]